MMINCKESAIRSSELADRRIGGIRKIELWYHLLICRLCRMYNSQIKMLGKISQAIGRKSGSAEDPLAGLPDEKLSEDAKTRIKQLLTTR